MAVTVQAVRDGVPLGVAVIDTTIEAYIRAAEAWMRGIGIAEGDLSNPAVEIAVIVLVKTWLFENVTLDPPTPIVIPRGVLALLAPFREISL
ncbi:head-tail connector protein [Phaeovulum sp. W22_SRMD_FR3]|uniref:head-tail connector protein n=1 Tax=Phaeovulum sp. W22_SRMD_FR3 TaxID=3240274 RepID=UPI003F9ABA15